ncbi:MAG: elongation factor P, partial [Actinomycetota bacterium]|nr:elongation factor P [Actinomycetota bacterium]
MATTNDIKNGTVLKLEGQLWNIIEFQHVKPGKGGAFVRTKMRNVMSGKVVDKTFNAGLKVGLAIVERKEMQYLYRDGEHFTFMDVDSYEQLPVEAAVVGDAANYMAEGSSAQVAVHQGVAIGVELPASVPLTVTQTQPGVKGD